MERLNKMILISCIYAGYKGIYVLVLHCFQCLDKELKREWKNIMY